MGENKKTNENYLLFYYFGLFFYFFVVERDDIRSFFAVLTRFGEPTKK
jgi:hypothetical protein